MAFEDACRGEEAEITARFDPYLDWIGSIPPDGRVIDLGCGRGEWLRHLQEQGVEPYGVDTNPVMVNHCDEAGLTAQCSDAVTALRSLESGSVAAISAFHLIENLPFTTQVDLVEEAARVVIPGGRILFETPNPENVLVGSHTFYHDPTHRNPITPTYLTFLLEYHGFVEVEIIRLHPYPEVARVKGNDPLTERVNGHLCGPQDFAAIATRGANG